MLHKPTASTGSLNHRKACRSALILLTTCKWNDITRYQKKKKRQGKHFRFLPTPKLVFAFHWHWRKMPWWWFPVSLSFCATPNIASKILEASLKQCRSVTMGCMRSPCSMDMLYSNQCFRDMAFRNLTARCMNYQISNPFHANLNVTSILAFWSLYLMGIETSRAATYISAHLHTIVLRNWGKLFCLINPSAVKG